MYLLFSWIHTWGFGTLPGIWGPPWGLGPSLGFETLPGVLGPTLGFGDTQKGQDSVDFFYLGPSRVIIWKINL